LPYIALVNRQAEILLGFTEQEVLGKPMAMVIRALDEKKKPVDKIILAKHTANYYYLTKDSFPLPVSVTTSPLILNEMHVGAILVFKDRTKDQEVSEMKNEFISMAAHQLRSPLSVMRWNLELFLKESIMLAPKDKVKIETIYKNVQKMIALVGDMLSVSKLDQGKVEYKIESVNLVSIVKDVLTETRVVSDRKMVSEAGGPGNRRQGLPNKGKHQH